MMFENLSKKERFLNIWKNRETPDKLEEDELRLLEIMKSHDEFLPHWESNTVYEALNMKTKEDPFFHVILHSIIEKQIEEDNPPEVNRAIAHMAKKGINRHRAVHSIGIIMADEMKEMLRNREPFNDERYKSRLARFLES